MKTVKVRIAVAVDPNGEWSASGRSDWPDERAKRDAPFLGMQDEIVHIVTADLPIPEAVAVEGKVEKAQ